eukprot:GHVR01133847.1.p1 GENE.GHVR01133847.1~~GHVR01133847.1.p1  ORF type:complete len:142 (-),score=32.52 GHVR01133847.1:10-435(-)
MSAQWVSGSPFCLSAGWGDNMQQNNLKYINININKEPVVDATTPSSYVYSIIERMEKASNEVDRFKRRRQEFITAKRQADSARQTLKTAFENSINESKTQNTMLTDDDIRSVFRESNMFMLNSSARIDYIDEFWLKKNNIF